MRRHRARRERWRRTTRRARPHNWSRTTCCAPSSRSWKDATSASPCSREAPAPRRFRRRLARSAAGRPELRARAVREPARTRRRRSRRHSRRGPARRAGVARRRRSPHPRHARRRRRSRLSPRGDARCCPRATAGHVSATAATINAWSPPSRSRPPQRPTAAPRHTRPAPPTIVLAPDSFKGALVHPTSCAALAAGLRRVWPDVDLRSRPMADGGEGTLDTVLAAVDAAGTRHERESRRHRPPRPRGVRS